MSLYIYVIWPLVLDTIFIYLNFIWHSILSTISQNLYSFRTLCKFSLSTFYYGLPISIQFPFTYILHGPPYYPLFLYACMLHRIRLPRNLHFSTPIVYIMRRICLPVLPIFFYTCTLYAGILYSPHFLYIYILYSIYNTATRPSNNVSAPTFCKESSYSARFF